MRGVPGSWLIRQIALLVPSSRRDAWLREWDAELTWAWRRREGRAAAGLRLRLVLRAAGATLDAIHERRHTRTTMGMTTDLRLGLRSLLRSPGFTMVSVLTLGLGIGAASAVFTLVDGVLLRPLPFPDPEELVSVGHLGRDGQDDLSLSPGLYVLYRDRVRTLSDVAIHQAATVSLAGEGEAERVTGQAVTPDFFRVLNVGPAHGRLLLADDGLPGAEPVIVLSDRLWRTRFGGDPGVVGTTVITDGVDRRIVGIMPRNFAFPDEDARFWTPLIIDETQAPLGSFSGSAIGRLTDGMTPGDANTEIQALVTQLPELFPGDGAAVFMAEVGLRANVRPLRDVVVGDVRQTLWIVLGMVGFVLLIACANVANLLLVRAEGRQRELALRMAVGAGRWEALRPFLAESLVLGAMGGVLGVLIAAGAVDLAIGAARADIPRLHEVGVDGRVLAFTAGVSLVAAFLFGLAPALRYGRDDLAQELREGGARGATGGRSRLRSGLVILQVALALVLLVGSGLMLRSFQLLRDVDGGFDGAGVLTARITVPPAEEPEAGDVAAFYRELLARLEAHGAVEVAGAAAWAPLSGSSAFGGVELEDHPRAPDEMPIMASLMRVTGGYVEALGIPVLEGRSLRPEDRADGYRAVLVSESFSRRWWPGGSAVGRQVRNLGASEDWYQVVGVVGDVRYGGLHREPEEMVYFPSVFGPREAPSATRTMDLTLKVSGSPELFIPVLRRELAALNPRIALSEPRSMEAVVEASLGRVSFTMALLGAAAGTALLLGVVGLYGVVSYVVSRRTREIGVRMALGASGGSVRGMVVRQGVGLAVAGVVLGLVAAVALSSLMESLLFGVSAVDPVTYGSVAGLLAAVAALASWLPARRASRVDPSESLRGD